MYEHYLIGLIGLAGLMESPSFINVKISMTDGNKALVFIDKSIDKSHFHIKKADDDIDQTSTFTFEEVLAVIGKYISDGAGHVRVNTHNEIVTYNKVGKSWKTETRTASCKNKLDFIPFASGEIKKDAVLKKLLTELGLITEQGKIRQKQKDKLSQIQQFSEIFIQSLKDAKLLGVPRLSVWDAACGKSYLSFFLHYLLRHRMKLNLQSIGIDSNPQLVERCNAIKEKMQFSGMKFLAESNRNLLIGNDTGNMDVLYSLHACNTATDEAIALGITKGAQLIIAAPCCQREIKEQMKGDSLHVLKGMTKYPFLKERLADVITDAMRSLVLESAGYRVRVLKFVPSEITPKNLIIIAKKNKKKNNPRLSEDYEKIKKFFHLNPVLEHLVSEFFGMDSVRKTDL
jgi:hypothetical protein